MPIGISTGWVGPSLEEIAREIGPVPTLGHKLMRLAQAAYFFVPVETDEDVSKCRHWPNTPDPVTPLSKSSCDRGQAASLLVHVEADQDVSGGPTDPDLLTLTCWIYLVDLPALPLCFDH